MRLLTTRISSALSSSAVVLALFVICATVALHAQSQGASSASPTAQTPTPSAADISIVTPVDADAFVVDMAEAGMVDGELGKLGVRNTSNSAVKALAESLVADQRDTSAELAWYTSDLHLWLPTQLEASERSVIDRLSGLRDAEFDREFLNVIVDRQQALTGKLRMMATAPSRALALKGKSNTRITRLAEWSAHTLPRAQHHLTRAQALLTKQGQRASATAQGAR